MCVSTANATAYVLAAAADDDDDDDVGGNDDSASAGYRIHDKASRSK